MSGILIYTEEEAKRNEFAIKKFTENLDVILVNENYRGDADYVINRTNNYKVGEYFEKKGIRVFNPSSLSKIANDKQLCYELMERNGIEIMPINYKGEPVIKKKSNSHGGKDVYMLEKAEPFEEGYVYQKPASDLGKDVRVWLIGGKIITSILRSNNNDFRSNFCLGGEASIYSLNDEERELVYKIAGLIKHDYIGIDFIFNNGKIVFNEIEDTVGARMVYSLCDIDIIKLYCDYIKRARN